MRWEQAENTEMICQGDRYAKKADLFMSIVMEEKMNCKVVSWGLRGSRISSKNMTNTVPQS